MNKILVITATLGNRSSLARTIESVRNVNRGNIKHVVVAPSKKIAEIEAQYNIECLPEPEGKKGIYAALNHGFYTYAKDYDYITFINDDDYWLPSFNKMIEVLDKDPSIDFIYSKTLYVNESNQVFRKQSCSNQFYSFLDLFHRGIILFTQQTTLLRSELFFRIGGFDESYKLVADTKFWIQLSLLKPKYKYLNTFTTCYMIQNGQLSSDKTVQNKEHRRLEEEYPSKGNIRMRIVEFEYRLININNYIQRLFYCNENPD